MAATGKLFSFILSLCIFRITVSLYEDQAGSFDWRQQYLGRATHLYWEQQPGTSGGKRLLVASDKNVIAAVNTVNGDIVMVTVLGGRRVAAWSPATGNLHWEVYLPGAENQRGLVSFSSEKSKGGIIVAMTSAGVYGLSVRDGSQKWDMALSDSDTLDNKHLLVHDGTVYIITIAAGSEVKVIATDLEGTTLWSKTVISAWLEKSTNCHIVQNQYLLCYSAAMESFQVLNLHDPKAFIATSVQIVPFSEVICERREQITSLRSQITSETALSIYQALNLLDPKASIATSVQDLGLGKERVEVEDWAGQFSPRTNGIVVKLGTDYSALLTLSDTGYVRVKKNLPGSLSATVVTYDDRDYILSVERSGHEELSLTGYDVSSDEELTELGHKIHFATHNGLPLELSGLLARKKDGKMAYKLAIVSQDYSLQVVHKTGKIAWRREESVAYSVAVEIVDLPVSENQAKFEDEFGSHEDNILTMFMKRIKTQVSQLQTFITQQIHRLSGVKHHHGALEDSDDDDDDDDDLLRDDFNLNKMIVLVTKAGKVIGMKSWNGHIAWQHLIPELAPFTRFGREKLLLYIQRTTAHFPHPPQCVVVGKNKRSGRGHLFAFDPISGAPLEGMTTDGLHLDFDIVQSFMLGEMDEQFLKGVVMVDDYLKIHTYPETTQTFVKEHADSLFLYIASLETGIINGYRISNRDNEIHTYPETTQTFVKEHADSLFLYIASLETGIINGYRISNRDNELFAESVWNINLQKKQQTITNIVSKRTNEHVHSQGRVLGDRSVLYKYLNPNIILVTTEGEETGSSQTKVPDREILDFAMENSYPSQVGYRIPGLHLENFLSYPGYNFINMYMIDVVTGHIVFHGNHRRSKGPVHVVHSENWAVYNYYNMKQRRHEMAVLEMFEGKEQSNSTSFSSFSAPTQPLVMRQSFIFPMPLYTMAATLTEKGITSKNIIVALKTGGLFSLPKAFLDPRRPLMPTQETMEEGTLPYIPELPVHTEAIINYNQTVQHVRGIHTAPAGLESTSFVLSYGLDLFYTRVQPSKMFDVLKEDFEYWLIACVLGVMLLVSVVSQKLAGRKALVKAWK